MCSTCSAQAFLLFFHQSSAGGKATALDWWKKSRNAWALQVEHILPQTRTKAWKAFSKKQHEQWVHDLGNLCLTWNNQSLSNKSFKSKQGTPGSGRGYANSSLHQERELATLTDWELKALQARRERLITWAKQRWS